MHRADVQGSFATRTRESLIAFLDLVDGARKQLQAAAPLALLPWTQQFFADIGYVDEIRRQEKDLETAENRIRSLKELLTSLDREGADSTLPLERLHTFLEELTLESDLAEESERQGDAVTLITMHSCKGLEFPHVYIAGLEDGLVPHARSKTEGTLDEER